MWRVVLISLILAAGCGGGREKRADNDPTTRPGRVGHAAFEKDIRHHESAGRPPHHHADDPEDIGSSILGDFFQGIIDMFFSSSDD